MQSQDERQSPQNVCTAHRYPQTERQEYSALKGFFRQYEIIYVVADEHDVVALRTKANVTGALLKPRFKIRNVVLMSPDLDFDVAAAKIFSIFYDPDIPYGKAPDPWVVFPTSKFRLTVYTSTGDKALGVGEYLMGSLRRLGRLDETQLGKEQIAASPPLAGFAAIVQITNRAGFIGHSHFLSDPAVSSDLVAVVRYGPGPCDPGRPLEEISRPYWKIPPPRAEAEYV
ncbi:alpha/beta hydrolase [Cupriavidus lacunae]|uniref:Lnb N-terminal periplasmic domain-containing protein n=1 Tax=Cupriavidus lacunae TaxID=2666307 RepID=A0A370NQS2_9BURK|nr:alpha/beta hydrolase [Cupriavidus lacunae]RDK07967.1 hypothetical protein DN412_22940 [Cupriavidus lacunae]